MSLKRTADEVPEVTILETREAPPSHFLTRIESFSLLAKNGINKYESGEFNAGGHKWRLILCPNEDKIGIDSKYISVYLGISHPTSLQSTNWEVDAIFSIFLLNQISGNYHYSPVRRQRFQAMKLEWGMSKYISKLIMKDPSKGFLIDDNCVFGAEVFILEKSAMWECLSVKNVIVPYKHDWKISNFSKLGDCWTSEQFVVESLTWEVKLYPKGNNSGKGRYLSTYLYLIDSRRVKASFSICIKVDHKHVKCEDSHWFSPTSKDWGWHRFMELSTLKDPVKLFLTEDSCHLELEVSVQAVV